ncbi:hypothetical protein ACPOL_0444 [Acidisarcina polymorpha]|uniref:PIN domain-containing protein n=1 Tax=Acidisarcina polymorpha TaxID=2211140 RepID=A0A2Z5FSK2_9BACT|nr:type II toxin-antitoxin system VapC family toxin [Acidisarcina polymorpha]AXC09821.1 hypothetical protein ACPOL_0444 [Acidisarcina polymorpha]
MKIYLDASFMVSLYSLDVHSVAAGEALRLASISDTLLTSTFGELEVVNALRLRLFRKQASAAQIHLALKAFDKDLKAGVFDVVALPLDAFGRARKLALETTARLGTRTGDLLHVSTALELRVDRFYSFDTQQRTLAQSLNLMLND